MFAGLIPDRLNALSLGRAALAEAIAVSTSNSVNQSDLVQAQSTLSFIVERNPDLVSAALRKADGEIVAVVGDHASQWRSLPGSYSTDSQVQVPILNGSERWGQLELRLKRLTAPGLIGVFKDPRVEMIAFVVSVSFIGFYLYLGRVLRELDPSRAIPGRVRTALDTMMEGLLVVDPKGYIVLANQAFADIVSQTPDELIGQPADSLTWTDLRGGLLPAQAYPWAEAVRVGTPQRGGRVAFKGSEGKLHSFIVNASPVLSGTSRHDGVLISFEDVTELQDKEIELRGAKSEAEAANRAKTDFLTNMSHEIRTPMNAILGFTELLQRGYGKSERESSHYLDTIHHSGRHLLGLINDILDLSKVEAGQLTVEKIACAPHQVVQGALAELGLKAQEKGIRLSVRLQTPVPEQVQSDPARIRQVVLNLLSNAVKFTERGAVEVVLACHGSAYTIEVNDTGIGMDPAKVESMFDPFTQADASITRRFGGTGLGLAISRKLARALGGDLGGSSQPGVGTTMIFS